MYRKIAVVALILVLALLNWSIYQKEQHIKNGEVVYLKLVPVDPRSLMQGDYMALRFDIATKIYDRLPKSENYRGWRHNLDAEDGRVLVRVDERRVASFVDIFVGQKLRENELIMHYRVRNGAVKFATNAFFFEEGSAKRYEGAKYGQFRLNAEGELLLVAMADENVTLIE